MIFARSSLTQSVGNTAGLTSKRAEQAGEAGARLRDLPQRGM